MIIALSALGSVLGLGVVILTARDGFRRRRHPPAGSEVDLDQLVGRYGPSDDQPQIAGSKCVSCEQKIVVVAEAVLCKRCKRPVHTECWTDHRRAAHQKRSSTVYR
jgi:hypothetical protein